MDRPPSSHPPTIPQLSPDPGLQPPTPGATTTGLYLGEGGAVQKILSVSGKKGRTGVGSGGPGVPARCDCRQTVRNQRLSRPLPTTHVGSAQGRALVPRGQLPFIPTWGTQDRCPQGAAHLSRTPWTGPATAPVGCSRTPSPPHSDIGPASVPSLCPMASPERCPLLQPAPASPLARLLLQGALLPNSIPIPVPPPTA